MPETLTLHDVPDDLYATLERRAQAHHQSLEREVLHILQNATNDQNRSDPDDEIDRDALWERIRERRKEGPTIHIEPAELKRLMREGLA